MSITNIAGAVSPATTPKAKEINDTSSLDRKIEQLKKQLEQVKENKEISQEEKNKRITNIEKHIAQLEQQKGQESRNTSSNDIKKELIPMKHNRRNNRRECIKLLTMKMVGELFK